MSDSPEEVTARRPGRPARDAPPVADHATVMTNGLEAFAELGYAGASARELARRLGVSHNFINDRYGSKAAFWRAVVDEALTDQLGNLPDLPPDIDDAEQVRTIITAWYRSTVSTPLLGRLLADEFARDTERLDYLYEHYIGPTLALVEPSIERLIAAGRMRQAPMDVLFFAMIGPVSAMVQAPLAHRLGRPANLTFQDDLHRADQLAALVLDSLLKCKGED